MTDPAIVNFLRRREVLPMILRTVLGLSSEVSREWTVNGVDPLMRLLAMEHVQYKLVADDDLLDLIVSRLDQNKYPAVNNQETVDQADPLAPPILRLNAGNLTPFTYFARLIGGLLDHFPEEILPYFRQSENLLSNILGSLNHLPVAEFLCRMVDTPMLHQWLSDEDLFGRLLMRMHNPQKEETQRRLVEVFVETAHICARHQVSSLVQDLMSGPRVAELLFSFALPDALPESCPPPELRTALSERVQEGMSMLVATLELLPPDEVEGQAVPLITGLLERIPFFVSLLSLEPPSQRNDEPAYGGWILQYRRVHTSTGSVSPTLGVLRLATLDFFASLVRLSRPVLLRELSQAHFFSHCLRMFFHYSWNNFLHNYVVAIFSSVLAAADLYPDVVASIVEECHLLTRLSRALNETWQTSPLNTGQREIPTVGYRGHLLNMARHLIGASDHSPKLMSMMCEHEGWSSILHQVLPAMLSREETPLIADEADGWPSSEDDSLVMRDSDVVRDGMNASTGHVDVSGGSENSQDRDYLGDAHTAASSSSSSDDGDADSREAHRQRDEHDEEEQEEEEDGEGGGYWALVQGGEQPNDDMVKVASRDNSNNSTVSNTEVRPDSSEADFEAAASSEFRSLVETMEETS
mmetsp:Transcript_46245/g.116451  ORF Transcript_46245/g.116451 Transcript_46245/m.116451 type:complete len:638 (-) Transcript_46245:41-1954(-)